MRVECRGTSDFPSTPDPRPLSLFGWKASDSDKEKHMKTRMSLLLILSWISVATVHAAQPSGNDVSVRVFNSADVTVPNMNPGEWTSLTFNSERWDTANLHETATNSGRLKAPAAGKYYIFANITWESPIGSGLWGTASTVEWQDCHRRTDTAQYRRVV